jgi:light-regulated signal transduction histidine kinase (bacteriophytochrome)
MAQEQKLIATNRRLEKEITERINSEEKIKLLNTELMENIHQLELTNEELERFAYVASHDLQEPLRKIMIFSDRLVSKYQDVLSGEGMDYIARIMHSSGRMQMLIKNILLYSRASGNKEPFETADLNELFSQILADLEILVEEKQARIVVGRLPTLPVISSQFRQLVQNLLINALKFSKDNTPPEIHIHAEQVTKEQTAHFNAGLQEVESYNIYIQDNGIGFEQKYANEIFTLFKRLNSYSEYEGTGIGLSICKKIVEKHNGTIAVESELGKGSTFTISLPATQSGNVKEQAGIAQQKLETGV